MTANRSKAAISTLINFLIDADLLPYNVNHRMKKYPKKYRKISLDAPQELSAFLNQLNNSNQMSDLTKDSLTLHLLTGCRKSKIRLMKIMNNQYHLLLSHCLKRAITLEKGLSLLFN